jgi:hypothetical protein
MLSFSVVKMCNKELVNIYLFIYITKGPIEYTFNINLFSLIIIFLYTIPLLVPESTQLERNKTHWNNKYNKYLVML